MSRHLTFLLALCVFSAAGLAQVPERDHERARTARSSGQHVPLQTILDDAEAREPGRIIEVELDEDEYEIEILRADGVVIELEYDARTGELLGRDIEDGD